MKSYLLKAQTYIRAHKYVTSASTIVIIGLLFVSFLILLPKKPAQTTTFKSLDETLNEVGDVAGESTTVASPSATRIPTRVYQPYTLTPTKRPLIVTSYPTSAPTTGTTTTSNGSSSNPTVTPTKAPTSAVTTTVATATPTKAPTAAPTSTPILSPSPTPTSAVTPTPGLSASISTSISDGTLNVSVNANRELFLCIFYFHDAQGLIKETKDGAGSGTSCSTSRADDPSIAKIKVKVQPKNTGDSMIEVEKSSPF